MIALFLTLASIAPAPTTQQLTVYAGRVHTAPGTVLENALITIENGKLASISPGAGNPENAPEGALRAPHVTAGLIDASGRVHTAFSTVEQAREVEPAMRVAHAVDVFHYNWDRQLRSGVTSVLLAPRDRNVIGGLGVVLKTGGADSIAQRTLKADAVLRGAIGGEPSAGNHPVFRRPDDFYSRRPTTRMGVEWEWRKAFFDAALAPEHKELEFEGAEVLRAVLRGEYPLCVQAWATQDIRTAVFLVEELKAEGLGDIRLIVDAAAEAWKEPALLERIAADVILPPFPDVGRIGSDRAFMAWNVGRTLVDAGLTVALSSHGAASPANRLPIQAGRAMRGGLTFDEALAAVTTNPARMLGIGDRVGTLETGKDADLVLWTGMPFEATSSVSHVILDGALVRGRSSEAQ